MKKLIIYLVTFLLMTEVLTMAYQNEISGKFKMNPLMIGDGVDKIHSPLQVLPQMATDMLNLSSRKFPTMATRNGRKQSYPTTLSLDSATDMYFGEIKPYESTNGDIHYAYVINTGTSTEYNVILRWYVLRNGTYSPIFLKEFYLGYSATQVSTGRYLNGNFTEYKNEIYIVYYYDAGGLHLRQTSSYNNTTRVLTDGASVEFPDDDTIPTICPTAMYLEKLFIGTNNALYYSATFKPYDYTTAQNSGSIYLAQGGKITSLTPMRDRMLVSTETSLFVLMGTGFDSFVVHLLSDNLGIKSPKCVTQNDGIVYFSDIKGDIYEYNGNTLTNLTREPIDTGSRSGVKGGFNQSWIITDTISVGNNKLYCFDSTHELGYVYVFDLVKRRWYIEDSPYGVVSNGFIGISCFNNYTSVYYSVNHINTAVYPNTIEKTIVSANTTSDMDTKMQIYSAGTKQKETNTIIGTVTGASGVKVKCTITHPLFFATPSVYNIDVVAGDTATNVATKIKNALLAEIKVYENFNITSSSANLILESKIAYANESTFNIKVENGTCGGMTTTNSTETTTGSANTYTEVLKSVIPFLWQSPCYQLMTTGRQGLKAIHFSYYSPNGTDIGFYISKTVDGDDFEKISTLPTSALKQSQKFTIPVHRYGLSDWLRIKLEGHGAIEIYNMTMEWRVLEKLR